LVIVVRYLPASTRIAPGTLVLGSLLAWCALLVTGCISVSGVKVAPSALSWSGVPVGASGNSQQVTVTNDSSSTIPISMAMSGANAGDFLISSTTCGATLFAGSSCGAAVAFSPTATGSRSATLTLISSDGKPTQPVSLSGNGIPAVDATASPSSLSFGIVNLGTTSAPQTATLQNNGGSAISIGSVAVTGANPADFAISNNTCGATLAPSTSCTVGVAFAPTALGARAATLTFTDGASNNPQTVALSGMGAIESATLAPASLTFSAQAVGTTSASQAVTLTNGGTVALNIANIAISGANAGDFAISGKTCGASLAPSASCSISIAFAPTAAGARTATLAIANSATSTPLTVALSGTAAVSSASVAPSSLMFPATAVATPSAPLSVTLTNGPTFAINLNSIAISGTNASDFAISAQTCGATLAPSASCSVTVTFTPSTTGARTATLTFSDSASNSPQTVALSGTGAIGSASVSPTSLTFATYEVGTSSPVQIVNLNNASPVAVPITSVSITGADPQDFAIVSNSCEAILAAGSSCTASIVFHPIATGTRTATLVFTDKATNSPQTAALSGTGTIATATVSPTSLSFSSTIVGLTSASQTITLQNGGVLGMSVFGVSINGTDPGDFVINGNTCGTYVAAGASCTVSVAFTPTASGTRTAFVTFSDGSANSPQRVTLTGAATAFTIQPQNPTVDVNESLQFLATAPANWTVSCGAIDSGDGLYDAPSTAQTCTITATETLGGNASASTQVNVITGTGHTFEVYPSSASIALSSQQVFQAQLSNVPDSHTLTYSVDGVVGGNATTGTVTDKGLYTAPAVVGTHLLEITDNNLGVSGTAYISVFSGIDVDFDSRSNNLYAVPANMFGAERLESLHDVADLNTVKAAGITYARMYAQILTVFATSTPNWTEIDEAIKTVTATGGVHVIIQMYQTPSWLQQNGCGSYSLPTDLNAWGSIAAQYVQHLDATFPGIVTDYEIWNEPNVSFCIPSGDNAITDYIKLYDAAAPLMKAQAQADGATIRIGGPATAGLQSSYVTAMLSDPTVSQNIDFMSYHQYLFGGSQLGATWDTYNGVPSVYQKTQNALTDPAISYEYASSLVAAGSQPQGANLPIYVSEYNLNSAFDKNCCSNDPTYGPLWNGLFVADLLNVVYAYANAPSPVTRIVYYAATAPPYFCLIGEIDANMDCAYPAHTTPQPYPQYYLYQLVAGSAYLDLEGGGYMAKSISPATMGNGLVVTAFYTPNLDAVVIINPSKYSYTDMPVNITNTGLTSPAGTLYQIVNGQSIQSSSVTLQSQGGTSYSTTVTIGPYSVQAISLQ
jgi:hypothetical protein